MSNEIVVRQELTPVRYPTMDTWKIIEMYAKAAKGSREFGLKSMDEAIIKGQFCWDYGLPLSSFNSVYIVNGAIAVQSDVIAQKMLNHPDYEYDVEEHTNEVCTIVVWRRSKRTGEFVKAGTVSYSIEDAKQEGHAGKDTYKSIPRNMLFARAITNAYKWYARNIFDVAVNTIEEFGLSAETVKPVVKDVTPKIEIKQPTIKAEYETTSPEGERTTVINQPVSIFADIPDDLPQYGYTLQSLLETLPDNEILAVTGGEFPVTDEQVNYTVHLLIEAGKIEAKEDEQPET